jgi:phospholipid-binding lipoprotein MlaA
MHPSCKLLVAASAFLVLSFLLPSTGGERLSLAAWFEQSSVLAGSPSTSMDFEEEPEPFAETPRGEYPSDPLERMNRAFFVFNDKMYFWFLKPASQVYSIFIPPGLRTCIRNGFENLRYPIKFVNNVLQGKFKEAGIETGRFVINSTLGFAGFFEMASREFSLPPPTEQDTGMTLGYYGLKPGFYIVLPVFGPSTLRDTVGLAGDTFLNPLYWLPPHFWQGAAIRAGIMVNNTSLRIGEYEDFKKAALDPYASMRQAYLQYRENKLHP